ncbi:PREDICTED: aspartyl protease family protein 1 [Tarenaya hassleriana]|uniref:aspartyl protease family protein 1 n=1 Tax=Tarenaya hassleriana TaxID=28532 RepID=UPI00053C9B90|nr:PREDICTED: aspartyl protease family protein 1 [Tarenaya hassleriana]
MVKMAMMLLVACIISWGSWGKSEGPRKLTMEIHHRFSERVKKVIGGSEGLPEKDSFEYYKALVDGDRALRGRRLASSAANNHTTLTFADGNSTRQITYLHYANVTVGTPPQWFLVALDTGSDLFWLPCNCSSTCLRTFETDNGELVDVNIYDPSKSRSSAKVACNHTMCPSRDVCLSPVSDCPYKVEYLSKNTTASGVLVEDMLHLTSEDSKSSVHAPIILGCSKSQEGLFREEAVNGLMGLGVEEIGVPAMLSKAGLVPSDSFSMCFGPNGSGTISFGDKGSSDQRQAPLNLSPLPFYSVTISRIGVGGATVDVEFSAIFDSGTAVTWLLEPFYSHLTSNFDRSVTDRRIPSGSDNPFDFCYLITSLSDPRNIPTIDFKMKDGDVYHVFDPVLVFSTSNGGAAYCLAVIKQDDSAINIIGQNFMTNYRIVHDRERMMLGWRESDCYDESDSTRPLSSPVGPFFAPPPPPLSSFISAGLCSKPLPSLLFLLILSLLM